MMLTTGDRSSAVQPDTHPTSALRMQLIDNAKELARRHNSRDSFAALKAIASNYGCIALCAQVSEVVSARAPWTVSWPTFGLAVVVIASRLRGFENLVHEASHYNLFPRPKTHHRLEFLYAFPVFRDLRGYRLSHTEHHRHLGDPVRDPDMERLKLLGMLDLTGDATRRLLWTLLSGFLVLEWVTDVFAEFWSIKRGILIKGSYWLAVGCAAWYFGAMSALAKYYAAPLLIVLPPLRLVAELGEHAGLDMRIQLGESRTNKGVLHQWWLHPHNDGFHAAHHLVPQVPFHSLARVHNMLMEQNHVYRETVPISEGIFDTLEQVCRAPTRLRNEVSF